MRFDRRSTRETAMGNRKWKVDTTKQGTAAFPAKIREMAGYEKGNGALRTICRDVKPRRLITRVSAEYWGVKESWNGGQVETARGWNLIVDRFKEERAVVIMIRCTGAIMPKAAGLTYRGIHRSSL